MQFIVCLFVCLQQVVFSLIATGACGGLRCRQRRIERVDKLVGSARGDGSADDEDDKPPELEEDVRDFRDRLISRSKSGEMELSASLKNEEARSVKKAKAAGAEASMTTSNNGTKDKKNGNEKGAYETPVLKVGSVVLDGNKEEFKELGITLELQYLHKSVVLVTQSDEDCTVGVIINRPSRKNLEGWDLWFGGAVMDGGFFSTPFPKVVVKEQEEALRQLSALGVECLTFEAELAKKNPSDCIEIARGIWRFSFKRAKQMVADGIAEQENFWLSTGYVGWLPGSLEAEIENGSLYLAAVDGSTLLEELMRMRKALQEPSGSVDSHNKKLEDGIATWTSLMERIGYGEEARQPKNNLNDQLLRLWIDTRLEEVSLDAHAFSLHAEKRKRSEKVINLLSAQSPEITAKKEMPEIARGSLLAGQAVGADFILDKQFLHRSIVLLISTTTELVGAVVLNRPALSHKIATIEIATDREPLERAVAYGGNLPAASSHGDILWITLDDNDEDDFPNSIKGSGPFSMSSAKTRIPFFCFPPEIAPALSSGRRNITEVLAVRGITDWRRADFERLLGTGALVPLDNAEFPWDKLFSLYNDPGHNNDFGFGVWAEALAAAKCIQQDPSHPAATALNDWHALLRKSSRGPREAALASTSLADRAFVQFAASFLGDK